MTDGLETIVFAGTIDEKGHVKPDRVNETRGRLVRWKGRRVTVSVGRYIKSKSNAQLALFHGPVLAAWSEFTGYDLVEMKKELKRAFLAPQLCVAKLTGEEVMELPSLADLNSEQMSGFLEKVLREGRGMGIEFSLDAASSG